jgi:hypothetical protein
MTIKRLNLINHPIRMRICQTLHRAKLSTAQLHDVLKDVPKPSLYRHLRLLLEGNVIMVAETRTVNGIEEKIYTTNDEAMQITETDVNTASVPQLAEFVCIYANAAANDLADYITTTTPPDFPNVIFHDHAFFATDEEFAELKRTLRQMLDALEARPLQKGRKRRRLMVLSHPNQAPEPEPSDSEQESSE